jgi:hypothetical protein
MNITFTHQPIPELTIDGGTLAGLGFTPGTPLQLTLRPDGLWITIVTDAATWEAVCEASQHCYDLGADWVRENGELIIGGDWITDVRQLEVIAATGVIRLQRWEVGGFKE